MNETRFSALAKRYHSVCKAYSVPYFGIRHLPFSLHIFLGDVYVIQFSLDEIASFIKRSSQVCFSSKKKAFLSFLIATANDE